MGDIWLNVLKLGGDGPVFYIIFRSNPFENLYVEFCMRNLMTRKRYDELTAILKKMREEEIPEVSKLKLAAAQEGDLRENAGYDAAKSKLDLLQARAADYEDMLAGVEFIEDLTIGGEIVSVGTIVELTDMDTDEKEKYTILGPADSAPEAGVISFQTPLARGMIGKSAGTVCTIELPIGVKKARIDSIAVYKA